MRRCKYLQSRGRGPAATHCTVYPSKLHVGARECAGCVNYTPVKGRGPVPWDGPACDLEPFIDADPDLTVAEHCAALHDAGWSWQRIADVLDCSQSAVMQAVARRAA